jgi:CheY-like chemotaxis protein
MPKFLLLDEVRLRQVLINFVSNAIKFTDLDFVKLFASCSPTSEGQSLVDLKIEINDSGIGIDKDQQTRIFNAFEQAEGQEFSKFGGTGLGLSISLKLIEMMNGEIDLRSVKEKGANFTIHLPEIEICRQQEEGVAITQLISFSPAKILIVDDVDYNRELLEAFLDDFKLESFTAIDGLDALEKVESVTPDVILMDMKMPRMDGYEASRQLKNNPKFKDIPLVAITASALKNDEKLLSRLSDGYLAKPIERNDLLNELMKHLDYVEIDNEVPHVKLPSVGEKKDFLKDCELRLRPLINDLIKDGGSVNAMLAICDCLLELKTTYNDERLNCWYGDFLAASNEFDIAKALDMAHSWPEFFKELQVD